MLTEVLMPQLSPLMQYGTVMEWYKAVGDRVEKGELLCDIEGDKATTGIDAPVAGIVKQIMAKEGNEFPVKQAMCVIGDEEDVVADGDGGSGSEKTAEPQTAQPTTEAKPTEQRAGGRASPVARRLAAELDVDLAGVVGTGPDGLIGKEDVLRAKAAQVDVAQGAPPSEASLEVERTEPVTGVKRLVGERMAASHRDVPHIHLTARCIITKAMTARRLHNSSSEGATHVTVTDLLLWATGRALAQHKLLNSSYQESAIQIYRHINLGIAIAGERGLVVGVVPSADAQSLPQLASTRQGVVERVMAGRQTVADTTGATFTITNLGMMGVLAFDPIVPPGNAAILGAGEVRRELVVDEEGRMAVEEVLLLTLACDHRVADGVDGARFIADIVALLEQSEEMFA